MAARTSDSQGRRNLPGNPRRIMEFKFNFNIRTLFIVAFVALFFFLSYRSISQEVKKAVPEKSLTTVVSDIKQKKVDHVEVVDNKILVYYKNQNLGITYKEPSANLF